MNIFKETLNSHVELSKREVESDRKLTEVRSAFSDRDKFDNNDLQIFCAGSLGRGDVGTKSDLDLFVVSNKNREERKKLEDLEVLAKLISLNRELQFPPFSNDGKFLKIHSINEITRKIGEPADDSENLFTTRMLMLLESKPIYNEDLYYVHLKEIINLYIRDKKGHSLFKPIFIINDLLRYWRTLCLNYETIRNDPERDWRKKNINLKFSRALTVFSAVLVLLKIDDFSEAALLAVFRMAPMRRLAHGLDLIGDDSIEKDFNEILNDYEIFLVLKEHEDIEDRRNQKVREHAKIVASRFSGFIYQALMHKSISPELKKILVI